ncbi:MAG: dihydrodipicolinate synthase family protein [Acidobacteria bacterium]|nr:dihydrodipicolinate synthase family protein [Acidobacteriota bacterium]
MLLQGIFPPITTPFYPDGEVYYKKLEHNTALMSKTPVAGIVALGSTGEAVMLSDQETREVLRLVREATEPEKVLIAGAGRESARETIALSEYAAGLGYDVVMVRTPHYFKKLMTTTAMLNFYRTVADRSPVPVIIYNFPPCTGYDIPSELVAELAGHPNLIGIKESSGDLEKVGRMIQGTRHVRRTVEVTEVFNAVTGRMKAAWRNAVAAADGMIEAAALVAASQSASTAALVATEAAPPKLKTRTREVGFQVMVGSADKLLPALELGAVGAILAFADPAPTACYEIYAAWKEGDSALAREKQERIVEPVRTVLGEFGIPGIKHAMDLNGYFGGPPRLPLLPLTAEQKRQVEQLMADIRN